MELESDPAKSEKNVQERSIPFDAAVRFDFESALFRIDDRRVYREVRIRAVGMLDGRAHVRVFRKAGPRSIRVISLRKRTSGRYGCMTKKLSSAPDADNPEWAPEDFDKSLTFEQLPDDLQRTLRRTRGPQKAPKKRVVTMRLSPDVVDTFRATGDGWQTRIDNALKEWLKTHTPA
jgi:uncharacterized protein (DUF4415 family)/uncharacterized DUF497 family protein